MIRLGESGSLGGIEVLSLDHDPEKCKPVSRKILLKQRHGIMMRIPSSRIMIETPARRAARIDHYAADRTISEGGPPFTVTRLDALIEPPTSRAPACVVSRQQWRERDKDLG
ncbi:MULTISPECIES: hypothetical protein [Bradyrhizobium]|uniref:Uncharacterized protein n=2 Tax=Bradyrhizobium TaxID=374 RepID=A0A7Y4LWJ3_9BRAD|nr:MULTISPECIES: hypothetical protein [Bradyrhizobium]NOJ41488.1 hypothetical protein [Bradyrhizobium australiense]NOJ44812.1 hypothetical protein [Bradyrhizobium archetypum]